MHATHHQKSVMNLEQPAAPAPAGSDSHPTGICAKPTNAGHTFGTRFRDWMRSLNKRPYIMTVRGDECIVWAKSQSEAAEHAADAA